ncbi:NAD(P)-dependent oxidoreductase [Mitsuokella sp.]|uniref:NAD(P)-dependent oxidoreductase n=1 Tax=Mitsuokella sp. TaxID=2049034 RepID=UPI003D7C67A1
MSQKLVIIEPIGISADEAQALKEKYLPDDVEMVYYETKAKDAEEQAARLKDASLVMLANSPLREDALSKGQDVKFLSVAFTGVDHVAMDYCREQNIVVSNCSGYANEAVSELVFGLAIGIYRKLAACDEAVRSGKTRAGLLGLELSGKTFGVVGLGAIGRQTAKVAQAFGCKVLGYNRSKKDIEGVKQVDLETLLKESDIVSLHVPLTAATKGLIGEKELSLMKPSAILINTARGPVVDTAALAKALTDGTIAAAGIDVFDGEPPIPADNPLLKAPHTLFAPHVGFATKEALAKRAVIAFENVSKYLQGQPQNVMG